MTGPTNTAAPAQSPEPTGAPQQLSEDDAAIGSGASTHFGEEPKDVPEDTQFKPAQATGPQTESALTQKQLKNSRKRIADEKLDTMSVAEIRAVGHDRGYKLPPGGRAVSLNAFKAAQAEDKTLDEAESEE